MELIFSLLFFAVPLVVCGMIIGRTVEKNHFAELDQKEAANRDFLVTNLKTFLEKTSGYRRKLREVEYGPLTDPDFLLSASPNQKIGAIRVPMFIAHGFNDPRVPVEEAMQLSIELKDRALKEKKPELTPQLLVFPDEGHGFAKLDNRLLFAKQVTAFMKRTIAK